MNAPVFPNFAPTPDQVASIRLRVLSLGAGVQSTTLALMAAHGEIGPMPDCAIFADTGWEPKAVYEHLDWLRSPNVLPSPVHIVSAGDLRADLLAGAQGERWASIPAFTRTVTPAGTELPVYDEDDNGDPMIVGTRIVATERVGIGMIRRQCTGDYKIVPIRRKVRELLGIAGRRSPTVPIAEQWIGISLDEAIRMKPSFEDWQVNRWPLIERGMTRQDCLRWLERHGYPLPPKSSCIGCPFHSDAVWWQMRNDDRDSWADAVAVDPSYPHRLPRHPCQRLSPSFRRAARQGGSDDRCRSRPARSLAQRMRGHMRGMTPPIARIAAEKASTFQRDLWRAER